MSKQELPHLDDDLVSKAIELVEGAPGLSKRNKNDLKAQIK